MLWISIKFVENLKSMPDKITEKVKTTVVLDKTLKKLVEIYAIQNDLTLQELVSRALKEYIDKN